MHVRRWAMMLYLFHSQFGTQVANSVVMSSPGNERIVAVISRLRSTTMPWLIAQPWKESI